jgi:hypothetical protein
LKLLLQVKASSLPLSNVDPHVNQAKYHNLAHIRSWVLESSKESWQQPAWCYLHQL